MRDPENYGERNTDKSEELNRNEAQVGRYLEEKQYYGFIRNLKRCNERITLRLGEKEEKFSPKFEYEFEAGKRVLAAAKPKGHKGFNRWLSIKSLWKLDGPCILEIYGSTREGKVYLHDRVVPDPDLKHFFRKLGEKK